MLVGYMMPAFSFRDLEDTTISYTPQSFRGKFVLLDFWATWCAPCVEEIRFIDSAYQRFRGAGLEVLSVSLDESRAHVQAFRRGRSPMPWKNAHVAKGLQPETIAAYDVTFPKPILLDPSGKIAATEDRLRGPMLGTTLEKLLRK
jgi:peroxiredoxin